MNKENAFDCVVDRIMNRRCVPVAGAGISLGSNPPSGEWVHNVPWMVRALKKGLLKRRLSRHEPENHGGICSRCCLMAFNTLGCFIESGNDYCFLCDIRNAVNENKLGVLSELYLWEFPSLDEAYKSLVELLKIDLYRDLEPTSAHQYIAKLSREGLINEVITTNYDCNFEKAYDSLSSVGKSDMISCLDEYREKGAQIDGMSRLKVFKINGCAERLGDKSFKNRYASILLTERQLQKWRNRQWAADIFKDRLRSKSLFFIGFGSDEPQIHHTLQTVLDEYTDAGNQSSEHRSILDIPSVPIVAIYDEYPTFHQQQIVNTYALLHDKAPRDGDKLIIKSPELNKKLSADVLWKCIYERVARALIIDAVKDSALSMNASFTSVLPFSQSILHQVLSTLEEISKQDFDHFTASPEWLNYPSYNDSKVLPYEYFVSSLSRLNGSEMHKYDSISQNKALVSELSILLFLLKDHLVEPPINNSGEGIRLRFKTEEKESQGNRSLYLNANPSSAMSSDEISSPTENNHLSLLLGQAGARIRPSLRRVVNKDNNANSINPKTIITLSWQHIFYGKPYAGNKDSVINTILDAAKSPTHYFYENQPSIKRRAYLREVNDGANVEN